MEAYKIQIIESIMALLIFLISKFTFRYFVKLKILNSFFKNSEKKDILKLINLQLQNKALSITPNKKTRQFIVNNLNS